MDGAVHRIFTGFLYKFINAARIKTCWIDYLPSSGFLSTLQYMYAYSLYLYWTSPGRASPLPSG